MVARMIAMLLARLAPYKLAAEILVFGLLAAGMVYEVHQFLEHERDIGRQEVQARWNAQKVVDKAAGDKQEKDWREKYDAAINLGTKNAEALRTDANAARAASDRLRDTNQSLQQLLAGASAETARKYASAYQAVFADCVGRYRAMGEAAQGHANDAATLSAAWPQGAPKPQP
jgi:hypothetical protein